MKPDMIESPDEVADRDAERQRQRRQDRELAEQDHGDFRSREAEHPQAGQLAAAL